MRPGSRVEYGNNRVQEIVSGTQPGKPAQNGFIERFNRTYRTEVLSAYVFESLDQVRGISGVWLQSYNEARPHDTLAGLPLATYRAQLNAESSTLGGISLTGKLIQHGMGAKEELIE
jgi:putative transposase